MWILCSVQVNVVKSDFNLHKKKLCLRSHLTDLELNIFKTL